MPSSGRRAFTLVVLAVTATVAGTLHRLPGRIATHFDAPGAPNGWSSHTAYVAILAAVGVLLPLAIVGSVAWLGTARAEWLDVPARQYWLQPNHRSEGLRRVTDHTWWLACLMAALTLGTHLVVLRANESDPPRLPTTFFLGMLLAFVGGVAAWIAAFYVVLRPPRQARAGPE